MSLSESIPAAPAPARRAAPRALLPEVERGALERVAPALLVAAIVVHAVAVTTLGVLRYRHYLFADFDLAIFVQAARGALAGEPWSSIRGMSWLGDHASLVMYPIALLYALVPHPATLLALQSAAVGLGALALHRLARQETGDERVALAFAAAYLLNPAVGYATLFEFHPETLATPALLWAFLAVRRGRVGPAAIGAGLALLCREDAALAVAPLGLYALALRRPGSAALGVTLLALAAVSLALSFAVLFPAFNHGEAEHLRRYAAWGETPGEIAGAVLARPAEALAALFGGSAGAARREYLVHLLAPFAFLPLLAPGALLAAAPAALEHLLSARPQQHTIVYQYTALVSPFVAAAAALGARRLIGGAGRAGRYGRAGAIFPALGEDPARARRRGAALAIALLAAAALAHAAFGPFGPGARLPARLFPSAHDAARAAHRDRMVERVPRGPEVVASFEFLPRLAALHAADRVHSAHHVARGVFTMSSRPYPEVADAGALLADFGPRPGWRAPEPAATARIAALIRRHRLAPAALVEGDVLFLRAPAEPFPLWTLGPAAAGAPAVAWDAGVALAGASIDSTVAAGDPLAVRLAWRRTGALAGPLAVETSWYDAAGRRVLAQRRWLGYGVFDPAGWPADRVVVEAARPLAPAAAGEYGIGLRLLAADGSVVPPNAAGSVAPGPGALVPLARVSVLRARR